MKKTYEMPSVEIVKFQYRDQVVAASGVTERCVSVWVNQGDDACTSGNQYLRPYNNQ